MIPQAAVDEITALERAGKLTPRDVVEHARNPESALHPHFQWDDALAAHAHRLIQAERLIIRARVRILPRTDDTPREIRASVSTVASPSTEPIAYGREANAPWLRSITSPGPDPSNDNGRRVQEPHPAPPRAVMPAPAAPLAEPTPTRPPPQAARPQPMPQAARAAPREEPVDEPWPPLRHRVANRDGAAPDDQLDPADIAELLRIALAELATFRRRYARVAALEPVFLAIERLTGLALEHEDRATRHARAIRFARTLVDREGLDRQAAAERASAALGVERFEILEGLRREAI